MGDVKNGSECCEARYQDGQATGVGGGRWYRFGATWVFPSPNYGDALPLTPPGDNTGDDRCGTIGTIWLSGWSPKKACRFDADCLNGCLSSGHCAPPLDYSASGHYPAASVGVANMTACTNTNGYQCYDAAVVGVVR